ncbi:MAG: gliding motility-associated C-terminal domain-containing protein [Bacteroidetes bacterium]|nr:gliding motility-associated C-terminal domain-containing protein [Bacteroidota bacterium]
MKKIITSFFFIYSFAAFAQKIPVVMNHQYCTTARVVCSISNTPSEGSLCNASCSGNNNLVNGTNSCFTGGLTRWGFYMFSIEQSGTLTFTINPNSPSFFDCGDYNFALFDVSNGCGSLGNALRCSIADDGCTGANTGLNMSDPDTSEGTGGDGWCKYLNAQCGHTYLLCLDIPGNDGNGFTLSFGGTCTFGAPAGFTAVPDTVCQGQPVNFSLTCNVTNAFITYSWNFGPNATPSTFTGQNPPPVTFSANGPQNITLTSTFTAGSSCVNSSSQTVFVTNGAPTSAFTASSPACLGTNTTVTYTSNASSAASYNWNFGGGTIVSGSGQGPYVISYSSAGTYTISLDVTECATPSGPTTQTITVFPSPVANAGPDASICAGTSTTLNGSGGVNYGWGPSGAGLSCTLCQNPVATPSVTTTYTLAVMDANGCTNTDMVTVTVNPLPSVSISGNTTICAGNSTTLTASGGNFYSWSTTATMASISVSPSASTTYSVVGVDANGCFNVASTSVMVNPLPTANAGANVTICAGQTTTLSASGGINYVWTPSSSLSNPNSSNPIANPTSTTTYTVTVTDANGCSNKSSVTVTVNPIPVANAGPNQNICFGSSTTLSGSGGINYSWVPSTALSNPNISNPVANPTSTTTYTLIVSNGNCASAASVNVTVNPNPTATISSQSVTCCALCNGSATVSPSNGSSPYTFIWSDPQAQTTPTASGLCNGTYTVTVTDANGCFATQTVSIAAPVCLTASATATAASCNGGSNGTATVNVNGGIQNYMYLWLPSGANSSTATGLSAGGYTVVITDGNGCTMIASTTVSQPPAITSSLSSMNAGCAMTNGTATANAGGGTAPYTYSWSNGGTTSQISNLASQIYSVTITDANGCTHTDTISVFENPPPVASISGNANLCIGEGTTLTASGGGTYLWNTFQSSPNISVAPTVTTGYSVIVTSGNCTDTASVNVVVNAPPAVDAGANVTIPIGSSAQLFGSGNGSTYNWSPSSGLNCTNCQNPTASPQTGTWYYVIATDANGCTAMDSVFVFVDNTCQEIYLPTVFSPNADGENDEWRIYINNLACIKDFKIMVWDRWGEKVYQSANADFRWDGTYARGLQNGEERTAVFVYRMKAEMLNGDKIDKKGNVTVVK